MSPQTLIQWSPIRIDALGIITIFGAHEMDPAIGRLTGSWVTDWLPVLAPHVVAGNQIVPSRPGFTLYNLTDGVVATDVSSWFTRWLITEPITYTASVIKLRVDGDRAPRFPAYLRASALSIGIIWLATLVVLATAQMDPWGVVNGFAMAASVGIRQGMICLLRRSVDTEARKAAEQPGDSVKIFLTLPNGNAVTVYGPRMAVVGCLLTNPKPPANIYLGLRILGWTAFGVHVIAIGMSTLVNQLLAVALLLFSTLLKAYRVGDISSIIGSRLVIDFEAGNPHWNRRPAYIQLRMTEQEENSMVSWNLLPQRSNRYWWGLYKDEKEKAA
jgi:hypothetical protein